MKTKDLVALFIAKPTKINFDKLKEDSIDVAIVFLKLKKQNKENQLTDLIVSFSDWYDMSFIAKGELKKISLERLPELAISIDEIIMTYPIVDEGKRKSLREIRQIVSIIFYMGKDYC